MGLRHRRRQLKALAYESTTDRRAARVVNSFCRLAYDRKTYHTTYCGIPLYKWPTDLWVYQNLIWELRPDLILETGTFTGASALYFAHQLDALGRGRVITVDVTRHGKPPEHPRITHLIGSSTATEIVDAMTQAANEASTVMVVLDSDHTCAHVREELDNYADLVTVGSYLIVEDTVVNGHPVRTDHGPGPMEALRSFLSERRDFETDLSRQPFLLTQNPEGYLRRTP